MKVIVGTVIKKNNKFLMVQEAKQIAYKKWNFPAGHLEEKESITAGAVRETYEETGYEVKLIKALPIIEVNKEDKVIFIYFVAEIIEQTGNFDTNEILDINWFTEEEIVQMTEEQLRGKKLLLEIIKNINNNKTYDIDVFQALNKHTKNLK